MKKVAAFLFALVLAAGTIVGLHIYTSKNLDFHNPKFGYWTSSKKFQAPDVMRQNLDKNTLVVLGSSELEHGKNTPYHPQNMFKDNTLHMMLIGAGHYQCLSHAITLAAIEPGMQKRKAVLIVSPQWFRKPGVVPKAFSSRFSESAYIDMLTNPKLSKKTKEYISRRADTLLNADKPTQKRVEEYNNLLLKNQGNELDKLHYTLYSQFLKEKENQSVLLAAKAHGFASKDNTVFKDTEPDWNAYMKQAGEDGKKHASNNKFQISNKYFDWKVKPQLAKRKGSSRNSSYASSPEYDDLKCFLDVCKDLDIEPMLVLLPVNGRWYDYTEFPKKDLQEFYTKAKKIASEYPGTQVVDYSSDYYTNYFMEDTIHIGWKGWVALDEALYKFGK